MGLDARIEALRTDRRRGSAALADEALGILAEAAAAAQPADAPASLDRAARALVAARPAMVAIENRVHKVMASLVAAEVDPANLAEVARGLCEVTQAQAAQEREAAASAAAEALLQAGARRLLTVSWSDTVARALALAAARGPLAVTVPAGLPLGDGVRAAERLAMLGLEVELVSDAALGHHALACDAALVGADAVLAGGEVVNRAGTFLAALAMAPGGRPFLGAAEEAKVTWRAAVPLEEAAPEALAAPSPLLPVRVRNVLFDATPAQLVKGLCTERGVLSRGELAQVAERHRRRAAWME